MLASTCLYSLYAWLCIVTLLTFAQVLRLSRTAVDQCTVADAVVRDRRTADTSHTRSRNLFTDYSQDRHWLMMQFMIAN